MYTYIYVYVHIYIWRCKYYIYMYIYRHIHIHQKELVILGQNKLISASSGCHAEFIGGILDLGKGSTKAGGLYARPAALERASKSCRCRYLPPRPRRYREIKGTQRIYGSELRYCQCFCLEKTTWNGSCIRAFILCPSFIWHCHSWMLMVAHLLLCALCGSHACKAKPDTDDFRGLPGLLRGLHCFRSGIMAGILKWQEGSST